jgi:hypothetical protein
VRAEQINNSQRDAARDNRVSFLATIPTLTVSCCVSSSSSILYSAYFRYEMEMTTYVLEPWEKYIFSQTRTAHFSHSRTNSQQRAPHTTQVSHSADRALNGVCACHVQTRAFWLWRRARVTLSIPPSGSSASEHQVVMSYIWSVSM